MNKRILISLSVIGAVAAIAIGGTVTYFSDTETSSGNTFTAGILNLQVGTNDSTREKIELENLKPGDSGNAATWEVTNTGSITGNLSVELSAIKNYEKGCKEPEKHDATNPDSSCGTGDDQGELSANLKVAIWMDADKNGTWSEGDYYLTSDGTKVSYNGETSFPTAAYATLSSFGGKTWSNVQTVFNNSAAGKFHVEYQLPGDTTGNIVQSDSVSFNITFTLEQSH